MEDLCLGAQYNEALPLQPLLSAGFSVRLYHLLLLLTEYVFTDAVK